MTVDVCSYVVNKTADYCPATCFRIVLGDIGKSVSSSICFGN